ncbi:MAG: T9SS type A sorting domain-containing protein [Bacteroidota bacterium]|nr:T9SS type A sorting domain-containing protein [Bacteroidota bacterium]
MKKLLRYHFTFLYRFGALLLMVSLCTIAFSFKDDQIPSANVQVVKCYPNPATSFVNFEFPKNYDKTNTLFVFSFVGKKMTEVPLNNVSNNTITITLTDYYRGLYVFQLRGKGGNIIESGKFSVNK